jgi:hypothetical protein
MVFTDANMFLDDELRIRKANTPMGRVESINDLVLNTRQFMETESKTKSVFNMVIRRGAQNDLNRSLERWLPQRLGRCLEENELEQARTQVMIALGPYFRSVFPSWILDVNRYN